MKLVKPCAFFLAVLIPVAGHAACTVRARGLPDIARIVRRHGGWPILSSKCAELDKANMYLDVSADHVVGDGVTLAWANVVLQDRGRITSKIGRSDTLVIGSLSGMSPANLEYKAIGEAIAGLPFRIAIRQIRKYEKENHG